MLAEDHVGDVPVVPGVAKVCVLPDWPLRELIPEPATPSANTEDPSQYLIWLLVELNQVLPLSPATRPAGSEALLLSARVFDAAIRMLPVFVISMLKR